MDTVEPVTPMGYVERDIIFDDVGKDSNVDPKFVNPEDQDSDYFSEIRRQIIESRDYNESSLQPMRASNNDFYSGRQPALEKESDPTDGDYEEDYSGRSTIVSTDVRDTIMAIIPSLVRIFNSTENIVDYEASREEDVESVADATDLARHIYFEDNPGFMNTHTILKDSLLNKIGVLNWYVDDVPEITTKEFSNISIESAAMITEEVGGDNKLEIVENIPHPDAPDTISKLVIKHTVSKPVIKIEAVAPEDFRISPFAISPYNSPLIGMETLKPKSFLIQRGYDRDLVDDRAGAQTLIIEDELNRNPSRSIYSRVDYVRWGCYYIEVDKNGEGINELRYIETIGDDFYVVKDEPASMARFAVFSGDPVPHTAIGDCIADITKDIQLIKTQIMRGTIDSLGASNNPVTVINEVTSNLEDALNDETGKVIRTKGNVHEAVSFHKIPFVGPESLQVLNYVDMLRQSRTGISEASKGVDPKALQSTTMLGVDAIVSGAQERIELVAYLLAETGFKPLFKGILKDIVDHQNTPRSLKINNKWKKIDPSTFPADLRVRTNPTLGRGSDISRVQSLMSVKQTQEMIIGKYGIKNQIVTPLNYMNTITDILNINNIRNTSRYFNPITDEIMKTIMSAPEEPDPTLMLAKAEMEKVRAMAAKALSEKGIKLKQLAVEDDFKRDKLLIESLLSLLDIKSKGSGEFELNQDIAQINSPSPEVRGLFSDIDGATNDQ